ncbi:MAG: glucosyl transferase [Rhodospirillales bacterium]|nr:glucosyl transferase [Rhodospirillales bacterium]
MATSYRSSAAVLVAVRRALARLFLLGGRGQPLAPVKSASSRRLVAYFGQDCTDSAVIRRISALQATGLEVVGFTFRRQKFNSDFVPTWDNVALGETRDRHYLGRLLKLARAAWLIARHRRCLAGATLIYARNIDMALCALLAKLLSGSPAPLVYEVLDIQRAFLGDRPFAKILRWVERCVLRCTRLLVVSSPGFMRNYFLPVQKYRGGWFLLENKILGTQLRAAGSTLGQTSARPAEHHNGRWVIGWFGTLRCVRSLDILCRLADRCPDKVLIYLRGFPTETSLESFLGVVQQRPNMIYDGEYFSPHDLPDLHKRIDFGWCFDFLDPGANSDWLLPNRFYDCGYFNVPALAPTGTWTGQCISTLGMGWTFKSPFADEIARFLDTVTPQEVAARRANMAQLPRSLFCEEDDTLRLAKQLKIHR